MYTQNSIFKDFEASECEILDTKIHLHPQLPDLVAELGVGVDDKMVAAIQNYLVTGQCPQFGALDSTVGAYHVHIGFETKQDLRLVVIDVTNHEDARENYGTIDLTQEKIYLFCSGTFKSYAFMCGLVRKFWNILCKLDPDSFGQES